MQHTDADPPAALEKEQRHDSGEGYGGCHTPLLASYPSSSARFCCRRAARANAKDRCITSGVVAKISLHLPRPPLCCWCCCCCCCWCCNPMIGDDERTPPIGLDCITVSITEDLLRPLSRRRSAAVTIGFSNDIVCRTSSVGRYLLRPDLYREGHYEMTGGVCPSVCLSRALT